MRPLAWLANVPVRRSLFPFLAVLVVGLAVMVWSRTRSGELLERFELRTIDARFEARGAREVSDKVVIVEIDDYSLATVGPWPWPRDRYARVIRALRARGAHTIAFDVLFLERRPQDGAADDEFVRAAREVGCAIQGAAAVAEGERMTSEQAAASDVARRFALRGAQVLPGRGLSYFAGLHPVPQLIGPFPDLARASRGAGVVDVVASSDGVFREYLPVVEKGTEVYPSLALAAATHFLGVTSDQITIRAGSHVQLGDQRRIPIDRDGWMLIDYAGPGKVFKHYSAADVLYATDALEEDAFRGKVVMIAGTALGQHDVRPTPYDPVAKGIEVQANALDAILQGSFRRRLGGEWGAALIGGWILLIGLLVCLTPARTHVPLALACVAVHDLAAIWVFGHAGLVVPMVAPTLTMLLALLAATSVKAVAVEAEHSQLVDTLSYFVPPEIASRLTSEDADAALQGETREVTVLFTDIGGFTEASAQLGAERTVTFLNRYFELMHEVIFEFGGTLDKFVGDEIMAFFNAPVEQIDHAPLAVACALAMQHRIGTRPDEWEFLGMPNLRAECGIHTGQAIVGYVGSGSRMQYTAIGETVNLASRLEGVAKDLGVRIVISEQTYLLVRDMVTCRFLGEHQLRGIEGAQPVYEVLGMADGPDDTSAVRDNGETGEGV